MGVIENCGVIIGGIRVKYILQGSIEGVNRSVKFSLQISFTTIPKLSPSLKWWV